MLLAASHAPKVGGKPLALNTFASEAQLMRDVCMKQVFDFDQSTDLL